MNSSRLVHSAKGHYPRLHVCWAAVLSNSTRCCCDHEVTCEDIPLLHSLILCHVSIHSRQFLAASASKDGKIEREENAVKSGEVRGSSYPVRILFGDRLWDGLMRLNCSLMHRGQHAMFLALTQDQTDSQGRQGWINHIWAKVMTEKKTKCFKLGCLCSDNPVSIPLSGCDTYISIYILKAGMCYCL